jgi:mono/diheme cytochrome c family protein
MNANKNLPFFKIDPTTRLAWGGFRRWKVPVWLSLVAVAFVIFTWLPISVALSARTDKAKREPRVHIIQDMDNQVKYKAQDANPLFNDGRAQRGRIPGTIARGELMIDDVYHLGFSAPKAGETTPQFITGYPEQIQQKLNNPESARAFLELGQTKFNITCAMCHGVDGQGNGPVNVRANELGAGQTGWVQPSNMVDAIRIARPNGHLYNTVNNGIRKMGGYGTQLSPDERWAVVAYVRTLQLAQSAPKSALTAEEAKGLQ